LRSLFIGPLASALTTSQKKLLLSALSRSRLSLIGTHPTQPPTAIAVVGGPVEPAFVHKAHHPQQQQQQQPTSAGSTINLHRHSLSHPHHEIDELGDSISRGWVEADLDTQHAAISHNALIARLAANRQVFG
jgi:hypothetical protein